MTDNRGQSPLILIGGTLAFKEVTVKLHGRLEDFPVTKDNCRSPEQIPNLIVMSNDNFKIASGNCMPLCDVAKSCVPIRQTVMDTSFPGSWGRTLTQYEYHCVCPGEKPYYNITVIIPHHTKNYLCDAEVLYHN